MTDTNRRFVFHGAACAFSGQVYRPRELAGVIASPASAAVSVAGGFASAESKKKRLAPWLAIGGATAVAEGGFSDRKLALEMSHHRLPADRVPTATRVTASIIDLDIKLDGHWLTASSIRASLAATSPTDAAGPPIRVGKDTDIKGFEIDGVSLRFIFDRKRFDECPTFDAMARAVGTPSATSPFLTSVVSGLVWAKKPHPTATIEGHVLHVPDFGRLHFGEVLISRDARRLTLVRLALGSPTGLDGGIGDVHTDGSWYPP